MSARAATQGLRLLVDDARVEAAEWRRFKAAPTPDNRAVLFDRFERFARAIARGEATKVKRFGLELADCEQLAFEALLASIERYDPSRGIPFPGFARRRIRGAIQNALPKATEANAAFNARKRAERDRMASLKRQARSHGDNDPMEALRELVVGMALGFMLEDASQAEVEKVASDDPSAYDSAAWRQLSEELDSKLASLPDQERLVIDYHYRRGVRFVEIAALLGLSSGRISQIHAKALARLRKSLARFR